MDLTLMLGFIAHYWPAALPIALPFVAEWVGSCGISSADKGWLAFFISLSVGTIGVLVAGVPTALILPFAFAIVGGTLGCYRVFKTFGVTSAILDKLAAAGPQLAKAACL